MTEIILTAVISLLVGAALTYLVTAALTRAQLSQQQSRAAGFERDVAQARQAAAEAQSRSAGLEARLAGALAERDAAQARAHDLAADRDTMARQFKLLSEESLEKHGQRAEKLTAERAQATQQLIDPLARTLQDLQQRITQVEKERATMTAELTQQIATLKDSGEGVRRETLALSRALRTPQVRGSWGEQSLRRIVEISGLSARCDFDEQATYTHDGEKHRPDMRINLADGKVVFVDSKVPLAAVLEAYNTEDEDAQDAHLASFARHVRGHIDALAKKEYWELDTGSPEFVVLYLPSDEFYRLAQEQIPDLHDYAARRNIMLSCPGTLIPLLHIVAHGWKQAALAESAIDIFKLGRELYDRLATLGGHFSKLQRSLDGAVAAFNSSVASLESRVLVSARKFRDLELTSADIPQLNSIETAPRQITAPELQEWGA